MNTNNDKRMDEVEVTLNKPFNKEESNSTTNLCTQDLAIIKKQRKHILEVMDKVALIKIIVTAIIIAFTYSLCFSGDANLNMSLGVFSLITTGAVVFLFNNLGIIINKQAFIWLIPIYSLSIANMIFISNTYRIFITVIVFLFIFTLHLISKNLPNYLSLNLFNHLKNSVYFKEHATGILSTFFKHKNCEKLKKTSFKIILSLLVSFPIMFILLVVLADGDLVFSNFLNSIDFTVIEFTSFTTILTFVISFITVAHTLLHFIQSKDQELKKIAKYEFDTTVFTTFLICINFVYVLFCISQLKYILFGPEGLSLPEGFTYSGYVRAGFFQLIFVSLFNFLTIILFINFMRNLRDSKTTRTLLILLSIFTFILIGVSMHRILLYIGTYGYTELRLNVVIFLVFDFLLLLLALLIIIKPTKNLSKYITIVIITAIITHAYIGNGFVAAKLNVENYNDGTLERIDIDSDDKNSDYVAYLNYAFENGILDNSVRLQFTCLKVKDEDQNKTLLSLLYPCKK